MDYSTVPQKYEQYYRNIVWDHVPVYITSLYNNNVSQKSNRATRVYPEKQTEMTVFTRMTSKKLLGLRQCFFSIEFAHLQSSSSMKTIVLYQQYFSPAITEKRKTTNEQNINIQNRQKIALQPLLACRTSRHYPPGSNCLCCLMPSFTTSSGCHPIGVTIS